VQGGRRPLIHRIGRRCVRQRHVRELLRYARMRAFLQAKVLNQAEARMAIFEFIEVWYNPGRRHSTLGYLSPIDYERSALETLEFSSP